MFLRKTKGIIIVFFAIILFFVTIITFGLIGSKDEYKSLSGGSSSATFSNLDVNIIVDKYGVYHITESFDVVLNSYGLTEIIRVIPYLTSTERVVDGKTIKNELKAKITNEKLTAWNHETLNLYYDEVNGFVTFGIKDSEGFDKGVTQSYVISYDYSIWWNRCWY